MAKLPRLFKIRAEDITDLPEWMKKIISPINVFFETVYYTFIGLTFRDNFICRYVELTLKGNDLPVVISKGFKNKVETVMITQFVQNTQPHVNLSTAPFVDWLEEGDSIKIYAITGIGTTTEYKVKLLIIGY